MADIRNDVVSAVISARSIFVAGAVIGAGGVDGVSATMSFGAATSAADCFGSPEGDDTDAALLGGLLTVGGEKRAGASTMGSEGESRPEVTAPPELRMTTSGAAELVWVFSVGDCAAVVPVSPVVDCASVVELGAVTVDDGGVDTGPVVVASTAVPAAGEFAAVPAESELFSASGVAHATPGVVATAMPIPSATANAPILPMCLA